MNYPSEYGWLANIGPLPKTITEALKELGTVEAKGDLNNPKIIAWAKEVGQDSFYTADAIPWCGLFMTVVSKRAGHDTPRNPLWALNWLNVGKSPGQPGLGDILVFVRNGGGHVAQYIAEDSTTYHVLGGNQGDCVCIERVLKKRLRGVRRIKKSFDSLKSIKPYIVSDKGGLISKNEA